MSCKSFILFRSMIMFFIRSMETASYRYTFLSTCNTEAISQTQHFFNTMVFYSQELSFLFCLHCFNLHFIELEMLLSFHGCCHVTEVLT